MRDGSAYSHSMTSTSADDAWAGDRVQRWLRLAPGLERQLAPVSEVLFAAARLRTGEQVLDVGCGTGPTTRDAALAVGPDGSVTGLDISADMLGAAATIEATEGSGTLDWVVADPVEWDGPTAAFDVVLSRFGVMFFTDPAAAFATLARAMRPGGRLAVAVWDRRPESDLFELPLQDVLAVRRAHGLADPDGLAPDGGPFSLSDREGTITMLEAVGWRDVATETHRLPLPFGGGLDAAGAAEAAVDFGPTRLALADLHDDVQAEAVAAITATFADHLDPAGHVVLEGSVVVVTALR